jgi:FkbM family methyltransferase
MISEYDGFKFLSYDNFHYSIMNGKSEPYQGDLDVVKYYLKLNPEKNNTYIDVGAHIGVTVCAYSKYYKNVIGYEVTDINFEYLQKNVEINNLSNVHIKNIGMYSENCRGNIYKHEAENSGTFYFKPEDNGKFSCTTIDEECIKNNIKNVDFIKIDTEGSELHVLKGAKQTIELYSPLIEIEVNGLSERLYNVHENEILIYLKEMNYSLFANRGANLFFYRT